MTWKRARIGLLLLVLGLVALDAWLTRWRTTDWDRSLRVGIYPIAADGSDGTREYVAALDSDSFEAIEWFIMAEAERYGVAIDTPVDVTLRRTLAQKPPLPPADRGMLSTAWWSLKLRWWSRGIGGEEASPRSQARLYVLYYDPATHPVLQHSLGLQKGMIGIVHAFASRKQAPTNHVIIAHELLHTLGATDKYQPGTGLPRFPDGYAEPQREPLHPQTHAELMGGRIPQAPDRAEIPIGLDQVMVGTLTAREIGWIE